MPQQKRVRESLPTWEQVANHYGMHQLGTIAQHEGRSVLWVLTEYLSKVGTWRALRKRSGGAPTTERGFWDVAYPALEGAPEWLREAYIVYVSSNYTNINQDDALRVSYRPTKLP